MSAFAPIRPAGFELNSILTSDELTQLDLNQSKALNAVDGGEWHPTAPIVIGGAGYRFMSGVVWATAATATFQNGSSATFEAGASATFNSARLSFTGTADARFGAEIEGLPSVRPRLTIGEGASAYVGGGGNAYLLASPDSLVQFGGRLTASGETSLGWTHDRQPAIGAVNNARISVGGGAKFVVDYQGEITFVAGGSADFAEGGNYKLKDKLKLEGKGKIQKRVTPVSFNDSAPRSRTGTTQAQDVIVITDASVDKTSTLTLTDDGTSDIGDELAVVVVKESAYGGGEQLNVKLPGMNAVSCLPISSFGNVSTTTFIKVADGKWAKKSAMVQTVMD